MGPGVGIPGDEVGGEAAAPRCHQAMQGASMGARASMGDPQATDLGMGGPSPGVVVDEAGVSPVQVTGPGWSALTSDSALQAEARVGIMAPTIGTGMETEGGLTVETIPSGPA